MPAVITDIKFQKIRTGRVQICLDHGLTFNLSLLEAARLERGQTLSDRQVAVYKKKSDRYEAYRNALNYLSYRPRSRREVDDHLKKKGFPAAIIADTLERLTREKLLDDAAFADFWLNRNKKKAAAVYRYELKKKGIEEGIISSVLSRVDEGADAMRIVDRKLYRKWAHLPPQELKKSLVNFLHRRGYSYDIALDAYRYACKKLNRE